MRLRAWLPALLGIAWIVAIAPALPGPIGGPSGFVPRLFGTFPDWRDHLLAVGTRAGVSIATLVWSAWAWAVGALQPIPGWTPPLAARARLADAITAGMLLGTIVTATLPPWLIWLLARFGGPVGGRPSQGPAVLAAGRATLALAARNPARYLELLALGVIGLAGGAAVSRLLADAGLVSSAFAWVLELLVGTVCQLLSTSLCLALVAGRVPPPRATLLRPGRILRFAAANLLVMIAVLGGAMLLLVPGLLAGVALGFAPLVVVDEDASPWRALVRSAAITRGVRAKLLVLGLSVVAGFGLVAWLARGADALGVLAHVVGPLMGLLWAVIYRQLARVSAAGDATNPVVSRPARDPALVVATAWSLALLVPFLGFTVWNVRHDRPTWLLLPPLEGGEHPALTDWCPYALYARSRECEVYVQNIRARGGHSINAYAYAGARCVAAADLRLALPRDRALANVEAGLQRAFAGTAVVERDGRIGDGELDLVVRRRVGDETVLLALDVIAGTRNDGTDRVRKAAALGVSDYWQVIVDPSREAGEMVAVYRDADPAQRRFRKSYGTSRNPDVHLPLASTPELRVAVDTLLAPACARSLEAPARTAGTDAHGLDRCAPITFAPDSGGARPELTFADFDADGVAHRFRFTAESEPLPDPLDLAATGIRFVVRGPLDGQGVVDAVLPPGARWSSSRDGVWTYRGGQGEVGGIVRVDVRRTNGGGRLHWDVAGEQAYVVPRNVHQQWSSIELAVAPIEASGDGPCGSLFFHAPLRCGTEAAPSAFICHGPEAAAPCAGDDADAVTECTLRRVAHAEEVFFAANGRFFSGPCELLPGLRVPEAVVCTVAGTDLEFSAVVSHPSGTHRNGCRWESQEATGGSPMRCS